MRELLVCSKCIGTRIQAESWDSRNARVPRTLDPGPSTEWVLVRLGRQ